MYKISLFVLLMFWSAVSSAQKVSWMYSTASGPWTKAVPVIAKPIEEHCRK